MEDYRTLGCKIDIEHLYTCRLLGYSKKDEKICGWMSCKIEGVLQPILQLFGGKHMPEYASFPKMGKCGNPHKYKGKPTYKEKCEHD